MKKLTLCIAALLVTFVGVSHSYAQTLTFDLTANDTVVGGTVNWSLTATVTDFSDNFGINTISADLDSSVDTLTAASVVGFSGYANRTGGSPAGGDLFDIGAILFQQDSNVVLGASGNLGPHLLASGSFTATTQGSHTLTASAGSLNNYFTEAGQANALGGVFTVNDGSVRYTVSAVPEPGSFAVLGVVALLGFTRRRRI